MDAADSGACYKSHRGAEKEVSEFNPKKELTPSVAMLLEQSKHQAHTQSTNTILGNSPEQWTWLAGFSMTSPPPTPPTFISQANSSGSDNQRWQQRQTFTNFALSVSDVEVISVDEILALCQHLEQTSDHKCRQRTVAELNRRSLS